MTMPIATYRLQFRNGMDFASAAALAPYLAHLGVSHVYASPVFQARPGSTHGYDVTDHTRFDNALGGDEGFAAMSGSFQAAGLGLILDIVPNHMAATPDNPWWRDVLRHGRGSAYAGHFDIDWDAPKLTVPVLGAPYGEVLAAGELRLVAEPDGWAIAYHDHRMPLAPETTADLTGELAATAGQDLIHRLHEMQSWRLVYWRLARDGLSYRRFFEIADLVGVRVEEPAVFDDVHRFLFEQVRLGRVQGLRIDHIDGLADPAGFLARLQESLPVDVPVWVEKILERGESLPDDWPVAGETGYAFAGLASAVLTDAGAEAPLTAAYECYVGERRGYGEMLQAAKVQIIGINLAAELGRLTNLAHTALAEDLSGRDWGVDTLRQVIAAILIGLDRYRTYFDDNAPAAGDLEVLAAAVDAAKASAAIEDPAAVDAVAALFHNNPVGRHFRLRFQQTSGAVMAKAAEDTLFYRYTRLLSANEVGGAPQTLGLAPAGFHAAMCDGADASPWALNATATHDTKRGEDARMRIAAIAEAPAEWKAAVGGFDALLGPVADRIDRDMRWQAYQALLGAWEAPAAADLAERFSAYLVKAAREAKIHTRWTAPNSEYEAALQDFARTCCQNGGFRELFGRSATPFIAIGARKSLAQLALKLFVPGIPDIFQGTERPDLSFVDPDNRRVVDFAALGGEGGRDSRVGLAEAKVGLLRFGLRLRRQMPDVFAGAYRPIAVEKACSLYFQRRSGRRSVNVAVDLSGQDGTVLPDANVFPEIAAPAWTPFRTSAFGMPDLASVWIGVVQ